MRVPNKQDIVRERITSKFAVGKDGAGKPLFGIVVVNGPRIQCFGCLAGLFA